VAQQRNHSCSIWVPLNSLDSPRYDALAREDRTFEINQAIPALIASSLAPNSDDTLVIASTGALDALGERLERFSPPQVCLVNKGRVTL